jgi:hypothetical protein
MATTVERAGELLRLFASALKPELTYKPEDKQFGVSFGKHTAPNAELPILVDVLDAIEKMAKETRRSVTVVIDEFQQVVTRDGIVAEKQIRSSIQRHRHVGYIFAASATRMLSDMTSDHARPFYRLGECLFLGRIPREEFLDFVRTGFADAGVEVQRGSAERILDMAAEVPYSVQYLAHVTWEMVRSSDKALLTEADVEIALDRILLQTHPSYVQIWNGLSLQQKRIIKAVAMEGGDNLFSSAVASRHRVPTPTMQSGLRALVERTLVQEEATESGTRYRLEDPLFGAWIRQAM